MKKSKDNSKIRSLVSLCLMYYPPTPQQKKKVFVFDVMYIYWILHLMSTS